MRNTLAIASTALIAMLGCAPTPPDPPSSVANVNGQSPSPQSGEQIPAVKSGQDPNLDTQKFPFGAVVGDRISRQKVSDCNNKGFYYDRIANNCTKTPLVAGISCTREGIAKSPDLNPAGLSKLDAFITSMAVPNSGYTPPYYFDQCVQADPTYWNIHIINKQLSDVVICVQGPSATPTCPGAAK